MHPHIDILPLAIGGVIRTIGKRLPLVLDIENAAVHGHETSLQRLQGLVVKAIARQKLSRKHAQTGIDLLCILHRRELQGPVIIRQSAFQPSDVVSQHEILGNQVVRVVNQDSSARHILYPHLVALRTDGRHHGIAAQSVFG